MAFKGFFVDDLDAIYATLLSTAGALKFVHLGVDEPIKTSTYIFSETPDIVAVDFRLDENLDAINPRDAYKGSVLAQLLRDKAVAEPLRDFSLVLITSEEKMRNIYRPDKTAHDLFDRVYTKERVSGVDKKKVRRELVSLCDGYRAIKDIFENSKNRFDIFSLLETEQEIINHQELRLVLEQAAAPHHIAGFVLREVIDRTGLLLSDNEVAARLGVSVTEADKFAQLLIDVGVVYSGIFHAGWRRWWSHRFEAWAETIFDCRPIRLTGTERVKLLKQKTGLDLKPARSTWFKKSSDEHFAFACASCGKPAETRHSLEAFDPRVPSFALPRRICWDCIQTGKYEQSMLEVNDIDSNLVKMVKDLRRDGKKTV